MEYELRAEYAEGARPESVGARVGLWHMTQAGKSVSLCGRQLDQVAWTQPPTAWGTAASDPFCRECGVRYLRMGVG
ncbi:hypothetical protein [Streptomyces sp. NPDC059371]|uniref:hypothetical protein n=1 Tax=Streptomyces sp. NPDC059371 TaxID=3346812 RepID=UPI0036CFE085